MLFRLFASVLIASLPLAAKESPKEVEKISEAFGHLISKNLETLGVDFDLELVVKGLKDASKGKDSPMSDSDCIQAITTLQEKAHKEKAENNLKAAEAFLKENAKQKGVVSLEPGKLQYKIEKKGSGHEVAPQSSPVIRYVGKYIDGTVFGQTEEEDQTISLEETIPGFSKGLVGMKEGEKRTLYIHPEYGYGTQGYLLPNSLLQFEIEIVKADSPKEEVSDSLIMEAQEPKLSNNLEEKKVR